MLKELYFARECYSQQNQPPDLFYKKSVVKNFAKFTGKHLCQSLFFNKVAGLMQLQLQLYQKRDSGTGVPQ